MFRKHTKLEKKTIKKKRGKLIITDKLRKLLVYILITFNEKKMQ